MALTFLVDTSVLERLGRPAIRQVIEPLAVSGHRARASVSDLEVVHSTGDAGEWDRPLGASDAFEQVETTVTHVRRLLQVQRLLAQASQSGRKISHRRHSSGGPIAGLVLYPRRHACWNEVGVRGLVFYGQTGKFTFRMLMTVLIGQSIVVFFGALVARGVGAAQGDASAGTYLWVGSAIAVLCVLAAGSMRRPYGVTLGWLIQVATFASAVVVPAMVIVGLIFLALWVGCLVSGRKVDETDARRAAEAAGTAGSAGAAGAEPAP